MPLNCYWVPSFKLPKTVVIDLNTSVLTKMPNDCTAQPLIRELGMYSLICSWDPMSNSESFTGGSGDLNPQYFNIKNFVQTGTDATTSITYSLAIDRLRGRGEFIGVLEIFRVYWYPTTVGVNITWNRTYILSTKNNGTVQAGAGDGTVIAEYTEGYQSATAVGIYPQVHPFVMDLTDGAGHGLLVATDSISLQCASTATNQTNGCDVKILYRYKNVPIQEYVGIVQSQT